MNWTLRKKLVSGFLIVCSGLIAISLTGYHSLNSVLKEYKKVAEVSLLNVGHVS